MVNIRDGYREPVFGLTPGKSVTFRNVKFPTGDYFHFQPSLTNSSQKITAVFPPSSRKFETLFRDLSPRRNNHSTVFVPTTSKLLAVKR